MMLSKLSGLSSITFEAVTAATKSVANTERRANMVVVRKCVKVLLSKLGFDIRATGTTWRSTWERFARSCVTCRRNLHPFSGPFSKRWTRAGLQRREGNTVQEPE